MTYPTSENTKHALAAALKQCMKQKPLDKISIREITDLCSLRRETFYYHFSDIYALVQWLFEEEALEAVLLGRQGDACITADEMAGWADTISYEILLSISERVPRVFLD